MLGSVFQFLRRHLYIGRRASSGPPERGRAEAIADSAHQTPSRPPAPPRPDIGASGSRMHAQTTAKAQKSAGSGSVSLPPVTDDRVAQLKNGAASPRERLHDARLKRLEASIFFDRLDFVRGAGLEGRNTCIPGTRIDILRALTQWVDRPGATQLLFLIGVAGSGKSTIANTLAVRLQDRKRLGAFFAFDRRVSGRVPHLLLLTLAYELALWSHSYRDALVGQLQGYPRLALSCDIAELWEHLIVQPAATLASSEPVLLVVDAFDECPGSAEDLLRLFTSQISQLPANYRVLITSRAEPGVIAATRPSQRFDIARGQPSEDIRLYIRSRLPRSDAGGLSNDECEELACAADGLFQWAATACAFLERRPDDTSMRKKYHAYRHGLLLGSRRGEGGLPCLDHLYLAVLEATFDGTDGDVMRSFRIAMSLVLCAAKPLSLAAFAAIPSLADGSRAEYVKDILGAMGVVLEGISDPSMPLRPMHPSFRDFLLDPTRSGGWCLIPADLEAARRAFKR